MTVEGRLQAALDRAARDRQLVGIVAAVERPSAGLVWTGAHGECGTDTSFFIASTTKLHTTAIVLRLVERHALCLDDRLVDVLGQSTLAPALTGLHTLRGVDHTPEITIRHLLSHTSGLADYFQGRLPDGSRLDRTITAGDDRRWTPAASIDLARLIGPAFPPGHRRKALYSDTNFQLLGLVIEEVLQQPYAEALHTEIVSPLGLGHTFLYVDPTDTRPIPLRHSDHVLSIPLAMTSFGPDGGIVSTAGDLMVFVRAFFEGGLFDSAIIERLADYRRIFFPLQYGVGFARFALPRALGGEPMIGHSGLSGAFAFLAPGSGVYVTGTVNNISRPSRPFQLVQRLVRAAA